MYTHPIDVVNHKSLPVNFHEGCCTSWSALDGGHAYSDFESTQNEHSPHSLADQDLKLDFPCSFSGSEASIASSSLFSEPLGSWSDQFKFVEESQDLWWLADASWNELQQGDVLDPGVGQLTRASSVALSEYTSSSDTESIWPTAGRQCGSRYSSALPASHMCPVCRKTFSRVLELKNHAREAKHKPFACTACKRCFSRQDALSRHREIHESQKVHPCLRCTKYQGPTAFRRRDHLRQHLLKKHSVILNAEFPRHCPYDCCTFSKGFRHPSGQDGFESKKMYSKHMREVHGQETHDCKIGDCDRVGSKGFARLNDLHRHQKTMHGTLQ